MRCCEAGYLALNIHWACAAMHGCMLWQLRIVHLLHARGAAQQRDLVSVSLAMNSTVLCQVP